MQLLHFKFCLLGICILAGYLVVRTGVDLGGPIKRIEPGKILGGVVEEKGELDVLVLGTSHGLAFRDLGMPEEVTIVNACQSGLGVAPLIAKCRYALGQLEKCRNMIIVVDEWQIASARRSEGTFAFDAYCFDPDFLAELIRVNVQRPVLGRYLLGVFGNLPSLAYERAVGHRLEAREQQAFINEAQSIGKIDPQKAAGRAFKLYMGSSREDARRLSDQLAGFSTELRESGKVGKIIFVFPPLPQVFRDQSPEIAQDYKRLLTEALAGGDHVILDLADTLPKDQFYSDEDHLTSEAARMIGRERILPLLDLETQ